MKLVVGLGNPGEKYKNTRHNLGFMVVDEFVASSKYQVVWENNKKLESQIVRMDQLIIAKPQTYMNNSGLAVKILTTYYKIHTTDLVIVHDDLDLPLGKIKVRKGGSGAGHHGVESIIKALGTEQFIRIRLGIGPASTSPENFVLENFLPSEKAKVREMIKQAITAIDTQVFSL